MKKFFKKTEGFTLVELIVVIAILGILAGVGTVGYSGYIKKANMAADQVLLDSLNTAFAAACIENGEDNTEVTASNITIPSGGEVGDAILEVTISDTAKAAAIEASFGDYFEGGKFKVFDLLTYANGMFTARDSADPATRGVFGQIFDSLGDSISGSVSDLNDSTFGDIGAVGLLNRVDTVTGLASGLAAVNTNFAASLAGSMAAMQANLGMNDEVFGEYMLGLINDKSAQLNPENPEAAYDAARYEILANYAVLNAAQNTVGKTEEQILATLKGGVSVQDIKNMMDKNADATTQQEGMTNAAMMYAMYTAYANGLEAGPEKDEAMSIISSDDISSFVTTMANQESAQYTGFQSYLTSDRAKEDVNGYLGAMDIINKSADGNQDAVSSLLLNGYGNPELAAALQYLMS